MRGLFLLILFSLITGLQAFCQPLSYLPVRYHSENTGLSHNTVTGLTMDAQGFLWVGTINGLNRFDGKHARTFWHNPAESTSISDNFIHGILAAKDGMLWVGTRDGGLNRFNPKTEIFERFQYRPGVKNGLPNLPVYLFYQDADEAFWLSAGDSYFGHFDPDTRIYNSAIIRDKNTNQELHSPSSVLQFTDKSLIAIAAGTLYYLSAGELQQLLNDSTKTVLQAVLLPTGITESGFNLTKIVMDSLGQIWVYDGNTGLVKVPLHSFPPQVKASVSSGLLVQLNAQSIIEQNHHLITSAGEKGLAAVHKRTGQRHYIPVFVENKAFDVEGIYRDNTGALWGTNWGEGFIRLTEQSAISLFNTERYPALGQDFTLAFEDAPASGLWIGNAGGLYFMEEGGQSMQQNYRIHAVLKNHQIWSVSNDGNGLWVASVAEGLFFIPHNDKTAIRHFAPYSSFVLSSNLHHVFADSRGWLWLGYEGDGLQLIKNPGDILKGNPVDVHKFDALPGSELSIGGNKIRRIYEDKSGHIWLATMENGFTQLHIEDGAVKGSLILKHDSANPNSLSFNDGRSIYQQNDSTFWFATYGGGLNRWNSRTNTFLRLGVQQGLANNSIYGVLPAADTDFLWISTNNGLSRLNTNTLEFKTYTIRDGLQNQEFNTGAFLRRKNGTLVFGGIGGFNIIEPEKLADNTVPPPVFITEIKLFNEPFKADTSSIFLQSLNLPYNKNFLSFEFSALDYKDPLSNIYAYMMQGVDADWVLAGNRNFADYPNLKPGSYTFKVKAANSDGFWNETGTALHIKINPPWWQSRWFRILASLILAAGFVLGVRHISQRQLQRQIRQMEIEHKLHEERERISRDLHDHIGAQLANIITGLALAEKYNEHNNEEKSTELMKLLQADASYTISQLRETIWALSQQELDTEGFIQHLKTYFKSQSGLSQALTIHFHDEVQNPVLISSAQALNLFRIIQEAAQNTLKYANAKNLHIRFKLKGKTLLLSVKDDGVFSHSDTNTKGFGLENMKKRAKELDAEIEIDTRNGTEISLKIPL